MMENKVDLPQPEGPAIETNSPFVDIDVDARQRVRLYLVGQKDLLHFRHPDKSWFVCDRRFSLVAVFGNIASRLQADAPFLML